MNSAMPNVDDYLTREPDYSRYAIRSPESDDEADAMYEAAVTEAATDAIVDEWEAPMMAAHLADFADLDGIDGAAAGDRRVA